MLAREHKEFIDLKDKPEEMKGMVAGGGEMMTDRPKPRGPSLYISDISLPITEEDIDKSLVAEIKITPRRISSSSDGDKKTKSFDFEITGIRFKS